MFKNQPGALPGCYRACGWIAALGLLVTTSIALANGTHTGHQFSVTETGGATISIPLQVPRGIGGMEPQLSLNYSSGGGNGLLGVGWFLAGPSSISRCAKTPQHDNGVRGAVTYSTSDRFCLDGQRLLSNTPTDDGNYASAGTVYWTERESFSRFTAVGSHPAGGPAGFKVETKSGLILEFGAIPSVASGDAQVMTNPVDGATPVIGQWMLKRISDRMQPNSAQPAATPNYVEFYYCKFEIGSDLSCPGTGTYTGSQVLQYIRYTNRGSTPNGSAAVMFGYEARPDRILRFHYGASQVQTQRLAYISTYLGFTSPASPGERVKVYEITYEPMRDPVTQNWTRATNVSRLTRVQELRGSVGSVATRPPSARSAADALPPLDFTYAIDSVYGKVVSQDAVLGATSPKPGLNCGGYVGTYRIAHLCP